MASSLETIKIIDKSREMVMIQNIHARNAAQYDLLPSLKDYIYTYNKIK